MPEIIHVSNLLENNRSRIDRETVGSMEGTYGRSEPVLQKNWRIIFKEEGGKYFKGQKEQDKLFRKVKEKAWVREEIRVREVARGQL